MDCVRPSVALIFPGLHAQVPDLTQARTQSVTTKYRQEEQEKERS
jgi:hypothetical protein